MKKIILALAVVLIATPAMAALHVTLNNVGDGWVEISYDANSGTLPRAFGLNVTASDANIVAVDTNGCQPFGIYMGTIVIVDGNVIDYGTPVAPSADPGALGGLDSNGITLEMGSLYEDGVGPEPTVDGLLIKVQVDNETGTVCVQGNSTRGNVVLEDTTEAATNLPVCIDLGDTDCYTGPYPAEWELVGKPDCWCASINPRQCHGDADGLAEGKLNYYVATGDLALFLGAWAKPKENLIGNEICADYDHLPEGKLNYRVSTGDLAILLANWSVTNGPDPNCP